MNIVDVHLSGTTFVEKEAVENFGEAVTEVGFDSTKRVNLTPEPTNEFDSNAIAVTFDGTKVGYLAAESAKNITSLMERRNLTSLTANDIKTFFKNGNYGFWMNVKVA